MSYLVQTDYYNVQERIQTQLVQNNFSKFLTAQAEALEIVISHLAQKYDIDSEFTETLPWNPATVYNVRERVIIDFSLWVAATAYAVGACVISGGIGYVCKTANSDATFTVGKWDSLGAQYTIYYAAFPSICTYQSAPSVPRLSDPLAPMFDVYKNYLTGDIVYWRGSIYTCMEATEFIRPTDLKQYYTIDNIPLPNVFPDDSNNNATGQFWAVKTAITVPAGTLPTAATYPAYNTANTYQPGAQVTNAGTAYFCLATTTGVFAPAKWKAVPAGAYWTAGDNRNASILSAMKAITVWILSQTVVSQNVPATWEDRFKSQIESLKAYAEGRRTLRMPLIQPSAGTRIRYGGGIPQQWSY